MTNVNLGAVENKIDGGGRTLGTLLRAPYGRLQALLYGGLEAEGFPKLRAAHSVVLREVAAAPARITDIAAAAGLTKQSIAYLVDGLIEAGYVEQAAHTTDARAKLVRLTPRGRAVVAHLARAGRRIERELDQVHGDGTGAALRGALEALDGLLARKLRLRDDAGAVARAPGIRRRDRRGR